MGYCNNLLPHRQRLLPGSAREEFYRVLAHLPSTASPSTFPHCRMMRFKPADSVRIEDDPPSSIGGDWLTEPRTRLYPDFTDITQCSLVQNRAHYDHAGQ